MNIRRSLLRQPHYGLYRTDYKHKITSSSSNLGALNSKSVSHAKMIDSEALRDENQEDTIMTGY